MGKDGLQLVLLKCQRCQALFIPPKYNCSQCMGTDFASVVSEWRGKLKTYTTIRVPPLGLRPSSL